MRITQNMILRNTLRSMNDTRDEMHQVQERISTQKRVTKASDDPLSFSRAQRFRRSFEQNEQFLKNTNDALSWISTSELSLDQMYEYSLQAYNFASQGSDAISNADIRAQLADSVRGLLQDSVHLANSQYLGRSIFSGTMTDETEPFVLTGDVVTYVGNDEKINRRITESFVEEINVTGQELMDTNYFDNLTALITALDANDETAVNAAMEQLYDAKKDMLTLTTKSASVETNLRLIQYRLTSTNENLIAYISDEEDANMEEEIVRFKSEEIAYQAALQTASEIMSMNIMNYLR